MPRTHWKGEISFGLVNIPIILFNSENKKEKVSFHLIDKRDNARIKYLHVNAETGKEVKWEQIGKGYQYNKDVLLPVKEDEIKYVAGESARTIEIKNFVAKSSIDFIDIEKTYYLVPQKKGDKGYVILREALKEEDKIGIAKVIISTKEYLAAIAYYNNALVLYLLRYREEIKPLSQFDIPSDNLKEYKVKPQEIEIAKKLIKSLTKKWTPEKYKDEYSHIVHEWAEKKVHKKAFPKEKAIKEKKSDNVIDFIDLLKKSLDNKKSSKNVVKRKTISHRKKKSA